MIPLRIFFATELLRVRAEFALRIYGIHRIYGIAECHKKQQCSVVSTHEKCTQHSTSHKRQLTDKLTLTQQKSVHTHTVKIRARATHAGLG